MTKHKAISVKISITPCQMWFGWTAAGAFTDGQNVHMQHSIASLCIIHENDQSTLVLYFVTETHSHHCRLFYYVAAFYSNAHRSKQTLERVRLDVYANIITTRTMSLHKR